MKRGVVFICFFLVLTSCVEKVVKEPKNLITQEKMAVILCDLAILNSAKSSYPKFLKENNIEVMPFIFKKHNIDSIQFVESDLYYASIPIEYQVIYEAVEECLENEIKLFNEKKERKNDSVKKANESVRDSIRKLRKLLPNEKDSLVKK